MKAATVPDALVRAVASPRIKRIVTCVARKQDKQRDTLDAPDDQIHPDNHETNSSLGMHPPPLHMHMCICMGSSMKPLMIVWAAITHGDPQQSRPSPSPR